MTKPKSVDIEEYEWNQQDTFQWADDAVAIAKSDGDRRTRQHKSGRK
jgi:hypothetical protein